MEEDAGLGNGGLGRLAGKSLQIFELQREREDCLYYIPTALFTLTLQEKWRKQEKKAESCFKLTLKESWIPVNVGKTSHFCMQTLYLNYNNTPL